MTLNLNTAPIACALCGATSSTPLHVNDSLQVVQCCQCRLVYVNPQPIAQAVADYYTARDISAQVGWVNGTANLNAQRQALWRERWSDVQRWKSGPNLRVLDIGCGWGDFLCLARRAGWAVHGHELSQDLAQFVRRQNQIPVTVGDLEKASFPPGSFDVITMWHVLEHTRDPLNTLRHIRALLRPYGILVIEVPNLNFIVRKSYRCPFSSVLHLFHFSPATLSALFKQAGFKPLDCRPGHTGYLCTNPVKALAKRCVNTMTAGIYRVSGINVGDSIRAFACPASPQSGASCTL